MFIILTLFVEITLCMGTFIVACNIYLYEGHLYSSLNLSVSPGNKIIVYDLLILQVNMTSDIKKEIDNSDSLWTEEQKAKVISIQAHSREFLHTNVNSNVKRNGI